MALIDIEDIINLQDFATMFRWTLKFAGTPPGYTGEPSLQGLNLRCESVSLPKMSMPAVEIVIRGHKVKQPGIADYGNQITLTLFETTDMYVTRAIKKWKDLCWATRSGLTRNKQDLKCEIHLERMDNNNNYMYNYQLFGCFLEDYDHGGDLDASTADAQKPTMTLSFDYFREAHANQTLRNSSNGFGFTGTTGTTPTNFA